MKRIRNAALFSLVLALAACDGGSRGSGITTEALGNVASVEAALERPLRPRSRLAWLTRLLATEGTAAAQNALEGIQVSIEGSSITDETDANGFFSLRGNFEGHVVIRFERMTDRASARMEVNVPAAGTLTLNDVMIDERNGEATAQSTDVAFQGVVASVDCLAQILGLVSSQRGPGDNDVYIVRLDTSSLHDPNGMSVTCGQLTLGETVKLAGSVNPDGTFGDCDVEVES